MYYLFGLGGYNTPTVLQNIIPTFTLVYVGRNGGNTTDTSEGRNMSAPSTRIPGRLVGRQTFGSAGIGPQGDKKESGEV